MADFSRVWVHFPPRREILLLGGQFCPFLPLRRRRGAPTARARHRFRHSISPPSGPSTAGQKIGRGRRPRRENGGPHAAGGPLFHSPRLVKESRPPPLCFSSSGISVTFALFHAFPPDHRLATSPVRQAARCTSAHLCEDATRAIATTAPERAGTTQGTAGKDPAYPNHTGTTERVSWRPGQVYHAAREEYHGALRFVQRIPGG